MLAAADHDARCCGGRYQKHAMMFALNELIYYRSSYKCEAIALVLDYYW